MKRPLVMIGVVLLLPARALGQSVDFLDQNVVVDLTAETMHVEVELHVVATEEATALAFLTPDIALTSMEVGGSPTQVEPDPTYPDLASWSYWPVPLAAGDEETLRMVLDGEPHCMSAQGALCTRRDDETILFPALTGMSWYFTSLFGADPFTSSIMVHAPAELEVVAGQGAPIDVVDEVDGTRTWTFRSAIPTEQIAVYARAADVVWSETDPPVGGYFVERDDRRQIMQHIVDLASEIQPVDTALYGPLGIDEVHVLMFSDQTAFGGMGLLGDVFLQEFVFDEHYEYIRDQGIAHELSHSWWGGLASGERYEETPFFAEAFAEYSAWRCLGELRGKDVRTGGVRMNALWYMMRRPDGEDVAVLDPDVFQSPAYVFATYHKGSSVLRTLEQAAGAEGFARALGNFVARGQAGLSTDGLVEDILTETGYDASQDVEQWLRATGFPTLEVGTSTTPEGVTVHVSTAQDFSFGLPVVFHLEDGTTREAVLPTAPGAQDHAVTLDAAPLLLEVDPEWTLVRRVFPETQGDVTFDGQVDAADLIEIALRRGGFLPAERRVDGHYDPLYDVDEDGRIDLGDLEAIRP